MYGILVLIIDIVILMLRYLCLAGYRTFLALPHFAVVTTKCACPVYAVSSHKPNVLLLPCAVSIVKAVATLLFSMPMFCRLRPTYITSMLPQPECRLLPNYPASDSCPCSLHLKVRVLVLLLLLLLPLLLR